MHLGKRNIYRIESEEERKRLYADYDKYGGVYKLHCLMSNDNNRFVPINRILGTDMEGVLYIGKTGPGLSRIGDLIKALSPEYKSLSHHAGIRYAKNRKLQENFPFERLCVTFIPSEDPDRLEHEEIQNYFQQFGEVPPLNANEP